MAKLTVHFELARVTDAGILRDRLDLHREIEAEQLLVLVTKLRRYGDGWVH